MTVYLVYVIVEGEYTVMTVCKSINGVHKYFTNILCEDVKEIVKQDKAVTIYNVMGVNGTVLGYIEEHAVWE